MYPKPTKKDRLSIEESRKKELREYRHTQSALAIQRDNNKCIYCWFLEGRVTEREQIHHVYGRGRRTGAWQERYTSLACTCSRHHPPPIITPGGSHDLAWVEAVQSLANSHPINLEFIPPKSIFLDRESD